MYTIKARFLRFQDWSLSELLGAVGVYVIWDSRSIARPTYIGEGNILRRLTDHVERPGRAFAHPWGGYAAIISGSTTNVHKEEARALEYLLLLIGKHKDRTASANIHPGSLASALAFCEGETLRVTISGYDPLSPPNTARPLITAKEIKIRPVGGNYELSHDWRLRKLKPAIFAI